MRLLKCKSKTILNKELKKSYNFFIHEANNNFTSKGYGLIRDKTYYDSHISSIASVGYGLAALVVGVIHKWINYGKAYERASKTLDTFLYNVEGSNGFYYHFVNMETAKREWSCEVSIIDTAIFICGAITAGEFFEGEVKLKADLLYRKINWRWYRNDENNYFYIGYKPETGFWGHWDAYAEQLMLYVLGAGSPTFSIDKSMYNDFIKLHSDYKSIKDIIYCYTGNLFTYQLSHAWINFMKIKSKDEINWFENSVKATKANRLYCMERKFKTYNKNSWGLTACVGPNGYAEYGASPSGRDLDDINDGTVAPCGAIGSIVYTPEDSKKAMEYYYNNIPHIWGKYGFKDGFNNEKKKLWVSKEYIGIDKGIEVLMIENYLSGTIWKCFMNNKYVKKGLKILEFN